MTQDDHDKELPSHDEGETTKPERGTLDALKKAGPPPLPPPNLAEVTRQSRSLPDESTQVSDFTRSAKPSEKTDELVAERGDFEGENTNLTTAVTEEQTVNRQSKKQKPGRLPLPTLDSKFSRLPEPTIEARRSALLPEPTADRGQLPERTIESKLSRLLEEDLASRQSRKPDPTIEEKLAGLPQMPQIKPTSLFPGRKRQDSPTQQATVTRQRQDSPTAVKAVSKADKSISAFDELDVLELDMIESLVESSFSEISEVSQISDVSEVGEVSNAYSLDDSSSDLSLEEDIDFQTEQTDAEIIPLIDVVEADEDDISPAAKEKPIRIRRDLVREELRKLIPEDEHQAYGLEEKTEDPVPEPVVEEGDHEVLISRSMPAVKGPFPAFDSQEIVAVDADPQMFSTDQLQGVGVEFISIDTLGPSDQIEPISVAQLDDDESEESEIPQDEISSVRLFLRASVASLLVSILCMVIVAYVTASVWFSPFTPTFVSAGLVLLPALVTAWLVLPRFDRNRAILVSIPALIFGGLAIVAGTLWLQSDYRIMLARHAPVVDFSSALQDPSERVASAACQRAWGQRDSAITQMLTNTFLERPGVALRCLENIGEDAQHLSQLIARRYQNMLASASADDTCLHFAAIQRMPLPEEEKTGRILGCFISSPLEEAQQCCGQRLWELAGEDSAELYAMSSRAMPWLREHGLTGEWLGLALHGFGASTEQRKWLETFGAFDSVEGRRFAFEHSCRTLYTEDGGAVIRHLQAFAADSGCPNAVPLDRGGLEYLCANAVIAIRDANAGSLDEVVCGELRLASVSHAVEEASTLVYLATRGWERGTMTSTINRGHHLVDQFFQLPSLANHLDIDPDAPLIDPPDMSAEEWRARWEDSLERNADFRRLDAMNRNALGYYDAPTERREASGFWEEWSGLSNQERAERVQLIDIADSTPIDDGLGDGPDVDD